MKQAYYKGKKIIGTADVVPCTACISGFNGCKPVYTGTTDLDWDAQEPERTASGVIKVVTEDGVVVPLSRCKMRDA